jgi:hypothetical protein
MNVRNLKKSTRGQGKARSIERHWVLAIDSAHFLKILAKIAVKACETVLTGIRMLGECYGSAAGGTGPLGTERRPLPNDPGERNASSSSADGTTMIGKRRDRP